MIEEDIVAGSKNKSSFKKKKKERLTINNVKDYIFNVFLTSIGTIVGYICGWNLICQGGGGVVKSGGITIFGAATKWEGRLSTDNAIVEGSPDGISC